MKVWKMLIPALLATVILVGSIPAMGAALRASESFSPEKVWATDYTSWNMVLNAATPDLDTNGDGLAEIVVELENHTTGTYAVLLVNGFNGETLASLNFSDAGFSLAGDDVIVDPTLYGITVLTSENSGWSHYFMVFVNRSDTNHVSMYSINYPTMTINSYGYIQIPTSFNYGVFTVNVDRKSGIFHILQHDGEAYLLYIGYYAGTVPLVGSVGELQIILFNETLSTVWEKTYKSIENYGMATIGADVVEFNGYGLVSTHDMDVVVFNLTADPGNTMIEALDITNGNTLWTLDVNGVHLITSPIYALEPEFSFDYDRDNATDFILTGFNSNTNTTRLYFIKSTGNVVGYYEMNITSIPMTPAGTDLKVSDSHVLLNTIDLNEDGKGDFVFVDNNTKLIAWDIAANTTLWSVNLINQSFHYMPYLTTSDIDADGIWDILLVGGNDTNHGKNVNVTMYSGANGSIIYNMYAPNLVGGFAGCRVMREISDINHDGIQDFVTADGYHDTGTTIYITVNLTSGKDGSVLWSKNVNAGMYNNTLDNWHTNTIMIGDVNGDGTTDILVKMVYEDDSVDPHIYYTYFRILSGSDGSLLWTGDVEGDYNEADLVSFAPLTLLGPWNQFDYNGDGEVNEIKIVTTETLNIYAVSQPIPELSPLVLLVAIPVVVLLLRRRHL